jgi:hypothetical protein
MSVWATVHGSAVGGPMKIILHIGMPKSGSSALQAGLHAMRDELTGTGILYPESGRGWHSHQYLVYGSVAPERLPRQLLQAYGNDVQAIGRDGEAWLSALEKTIEATGPHTLILSEESLFKAATDDGLAWLNERLRRLGDAVSVVTYVRRPSDYYLSAVQQTLKASHRIAGPGPVAYRSTLEGYARHVADQMHVMKYEPAAWQDRDIVRHFLTSLIPTGRALTVMSAQEVNSSLSAEAMALLAEYRRQIWPHDHNRFTPDTNRLVRALIAVDKEVGGDRRPHLHDSIRWAIDHESIDLRWLRDEFGVVFDGIDYNAIHPAPARRPAAREVDDICPVDTKRQADVTFQLLRQLTQDLPRLDSHETHPSRDGSQDSFTAVRRHRPGRQRRTARGAIAKVLRRGPRPSAR